MHDAKGRVSFDKVRIIHEIHDPFEILNGLGIVALRVVIEALAGELSDPNFPVPSGLVVVLDIFNKTCYKNVVVMHVDSIHVAIRALVKELLHPFLSRRRRASGWRHEIISLGSEGLNVLLPKLDTVTDTDVTLTFLVDFVHTKNGASVSFLDKTFEIVYLVPAPQRRNAFEAELLCMGGTLGTPGIEPRDAVRFVFGERGVITIGPGKTTFATLVITARTRGRITLGRRFAVTLRRFAVTLGRFAVTLGMRFVNCVFGVLGSGRGRRVTVLAALARSTLPPGNSIVTAWEVSNDVMGIDGKGSGGGCSK